MKILFALLALSVPALASTYTCVGTSADPTAINAALAAGGTVVLTVTGPICNLGSTSLQFPSNVSMLASGSVQMNYTGGGVLGNINGNNVTINGFIFNGGGFKTTQNSTSTPQSNVTFTHNTVQNITANGANTIGFNTSGYWSHFNISFNAWNNISTVPIGSVTSATNVENGSGGLVCNYPTAGANTCFGGGIHNENGMDNSTVDHNTFNFMLADAIRICFNWTLSAIPYTVAANNSISYNTYINLHRMAIESQGDSGSTIGSPVYGNASNITNMKMNSNFAYQWVAPYVETFFLSIPTGAPTPTVYNNTGVLNSTNAGYCFENAFQTVTMLGNVCSAVSGLHWNTYFMTGTSTGTLTYQNNLLMGGAGTYFSREGTPSGTVVQQYNIITSTAPIAGAPWTSNLAVASSTITQSGGNATMNMTAIDEISVQFVNFYLDGSPTALVTQELQDLNTNFSTDRKWMYHATFATGALAGGLHTLQAVATDVSGATQSTSQSFTVGGGSFPGTLFAPTSQGFGSVTQSTTSSPLTTVLTNNGTATLTISSITLTGTNAADFTLTGAGTCGATLAVSASCNIVTTFTPSATGARTASISVADNATGSPQTVPLTGTGSASSAGCSGSILTNCNFTSSGSPSVTSWLFAGTSYAGLTATNTGTCGLNSATVIATSSVPGGQNVELYEDNLNFTNGATYNVSFQASANAAKAVNVIAVQDGSPFTYYGNWGGGAISWMPTITTGCNTYTTSFTVINSPPVGAGRITMQMNSLVSGNRIDVTNFNVQQVAGVPAATLNPSTSTFGPQAVGLPSAPNTVVLSNPGSAVLTISSISITGDFSQSNNCGSSLAIGASCSINVVFTPTAIGSRSGVLSVADNASGSPHTAALSGTGSHISIASVGYLSHSAAQIVVNTDFVISGSPGAGCPGGCIGRTRATVLPATCIGNTNGLTMPMEIGPTFNIQSAPGTTINFDVAGYTPGAALDVCPEISKDGGSTWVGGVDTQITMLPLPDVHPALPIAPATFDPSYPNTAGFAVYNVLSDCSDIGTAYTAAVARQATQGTLINFPAGTVCGTAGNLDFASNPVDVNTWHPSDVNTTTEQITLGNSSGLAPTLQVGDGVRFAQSYKTLTSYPASTSCEFGQGLNTGSVFFVASVSAGNVVTLACNNNGVPGAMMTFSSQGTDTYQGFYWVPANRTLKEIILQPVATINPAGTAITPAWQSKMWTIQSALTNLNVIGPGGSVIVAGNADGNFEPMISHIRIVGAVITTVDSPEAHTTMDPQPWRTMYYSGPQSDHIIFDRTYWHNQPAPNRDNGGIFWEGYQNAIINSHFDELRYFHAEYSGVNVAKTSGTTFTIASGIVNEGAGNIAVSGPRTVTVAGSGSGQIYVGLDMTASNAFTVWTPSGMTASCTGFSCISKVVSGSPNGSCNFSDAWQKNGSGDPSVGMIGCLTVSAGTIGSVIHCADGNGTTESACPWISQYFAEGIQWMVASSGPGPYIFRGNKSICAGLCWHSDAGGGISHIRGDYTYDRNYFLTPFEWMYNPSNLAANPLSDGLGAYVRQPVEWKGGRRILFNGNVINGNWNEVEGSAGGVLFTAVDGMGITDVDLTNNTIMHGPGLISYAFNTAGSNYKSTPPVLRFRMRNNLGWDIGNPNFFAGRQALLPAGWIGEGPNGSEDIRVENNSIVGNVGINPQTMWIFDTNAEGVKMTNNILYIEPFRQGLQQAPDEPAVGQACAGLIGKAAADCLLTPTYEWSNNLMIGNGQAPSAVAAAWPSPLVNYFQSGSSSLFTVGWSKYGALPTNPTNGNPSNFNFNLSATSPWNAGSAGVNDHSKSVGVNVDDLEVAQGVLKLIGVPNSTVTTSAYTVSYRASDSAACSVGTSTSSDITSASWTSDGGGQRARNFAVTGKSSQTLYYFWVLCQGNSVLSQASGSIKTH